MSIVYSYPFLSSGSGTGEVTIQCNTGTSPVGSVITFTGANGASFAGNSATDTVTLSLGAITPTSISIVGGTRSEKFGSGASAPADDGVAIGNNAAVTVSTYHKGTVIGSAATVIGDSGTAIGYDAHAYQNCTAIGRAASAGDATNTNIVAIGYGATATKVRGFSIGALASSTADAAVAIGNSASATHQAAICLGYGATSTATGQCIIGGASRGITAVYIGDGVTYTSAVNVSINPTGGSGADNAGASLIINGGRSTGSATPGSIIFQTTTAAGSSSTLQTLSERMKINGTGIGFFGTTPAAQQTGGAQTAGASYDSTAQDMLQKAYNALRTFGLLT